MDPIERNLQATQNLLEALELDPSLLNDPEFIRKLSILRLKHEDTASFLANQNGFSFEKSNEAPLNVRSRSSHCHRRGRSYQDVEPRISPHDDVSQSLYPSSRASTVIERHHHISTATFTLPERNRLLEMIDRNASAQEQAKFALSSQVVEENYYDDALSTTREIPTIRASTILPNRRDASTETPAVLYEPSPQPKQNSPKKQSPRNSAKPRRSKSNFELSKRSKSAIARQTNIENTVRPARNEKFVPQITVPVPFKLTLRGSIENTYSKKFLREMMEEKQKIDAENEAQMAKTRFKANPVPTSTYKPENNYLNDEKYIAAMRKKVAAATRRRFESQEMKRSKSEGHLPSGKPVGYVPPTTYISPIPVRPNARSRNGVTRSAQLLKEATTPKGIKSHRATSTMNFNLRHNRCKIEKPVTDMARRVSPPDFNAIHSNMGAVTRVSPKPATVPVPFNFARSPSAASRHTNCVEKSVEPYKMKRRVQSSGARPARIPTTHSAQLREELNKIKVLESQKEKIKNEIWKEDNRRRINAFLNARSKTEEDIALRTKEKIMAHQETTREYQKKLAEMKQRVLNGPLIMEKQSALAQEHRLQRKFEQHMKSAKERSSAVNVTDHQRTNKTTSRRGSEGSGATFVVQNKPEDDNWEYNEDFESVDENKISSSTSSSSSSSTTSSTSKSHSSAS
ncbi:unnamed protein product [Caenorhabditis bovis]|uniref:Uncharacterized protein n=1 Tax=Caenorhabditis bovis TaxID=2654633 RepID=A0A8S1EBK8_9PELO|nr:unnamed protein product [Caenorhabditis bovis]